MSDSNTINKIEIKTMQNALKTTAKSNKTNCNNNLEKTPIKDEFKKTGISATKKIAGSILGFGVITAGVLLFKRLNPTPVKQLAEHIQFVRADKIEDAIKFAQENLGVKLDIKGQLKTANWINESLVNLVNKTKGKVLLPKTIKICKLSKHLAGRYSPFSRTVKLSEQSFGTFFERDFEKVKKMGYLQDRLITLYQEIGHGVHLTKSNIFNAIFRTPKFNKIINQYKNELETFLGSHTIDSKHFISSEGETFSQLFAFKMAGVTFPSNIEKIWKSL